MKAYELASHFVDSAVTSLPLPATLPQSLLCPLSYLVSERGSQPLLTYIYQPSTQSFTDPVRVDARLLVEHYR